MHISSCYQQVFRRNVLVACYVVLRLSHLHSGIVRNLWHYPNTVAVLLAVCPAVAAAPRIEVPVTAARCRDAGACPGSKLIGDFGGAGAFGNGGALAASTLAACAASLC